MPTPLVMTDPKIVSVMEKEPGVEQIRNMVSLAKMTVIGIGSMNKGATILTNGTLSYNDFLLLSMKGAVGDMLCHFIDRDGRLVPSDIEDRLISTSLETLRSLDNVIGVAAGENKAEAILAALRGGYLDILITDETTAAGILKSSE